MQKIPVYTAELETDEQGLQLVSMVKNPAMESNFVALSEEEIKLAKDEMKYTLTGALMIPDKKILRMDKEGNPFYMVFTKEQIEKSRDKFFKEGKINLTNLEHETELSGNYITESWIVEDSEKDKSVALGLGSFPEGTLMVSYKIEDKDFWDKEVMSGNVKGFSLEGLYNLEEIKLNTNMSKNVVIKSILANLSNWFKASLKSMTLDDGSMIVQEEDGMVYMVSEDGAKGEVLADGDYTLEDGSVISIEGGMIKVAEENSEMESLKAELEEANKKIAEMESEKAKLSEENEAKLSEMVSKEEFESKLSEIETLKVELSTIKEEKKEVEAKLSKKPAVPSIEKKAEVKQDTSNMTFAQRAVLLSK